MTMAIPPTGFSSTPYAAEAARDRRDMIIAGIFTIFYFLLFAFFWISSQTLSALQKKNPEPPLRTNLKIQRLASPTMAPPMQSQFADASGLKEVDKPDPRTALQSDRNTAASSKVVNGTDPTLGGQDGKKDDSLTMRDSQFSANPASPLPSARLSPDTPDTKEDPSQNQSDSPPSAAQAASNASDSSSAMAPPPDIFRDRSAVSGGAAMGQDASFASMGTALGRYQHKLYLAIGSRWNNKVQQTMAQIGVDRVVVRFHVNADGTISDLDIVQGNPNSILGMISADSIKQSSDLIGPFPADLKAEKPNGFPWQLAFRIY
jgi:outer membrane biosynthesis protein TonB